MKNSFIFLLVLLCAACNNKGGSGNGKDTVMINLDTVAETRTSVKASPVVNYHEKVADALNDWGFTVNIYETKKTFYYLMKVKYEEMEATDTLKLPNTGIKPVVQVHQGKDKYSCIVGFLDKEQKFREYKKVSVEDNQLKIKVLNHYGVYNTVK